MLELLFYGERGIMLRHYFKLIPSWSSGTLWSRMHFSHFACDENTAEGINNTVSIQYSFIHFSLGIMFLDINFWASRINFNLSWEDRVLWNVRNMDLAQHNFKSHVQVHIPSISPFCLYKRIWFSLPSIHLRLPVPY